MDKLYHLRANGSLPLSRELHHLWLSSPQLDQMHSISNLDLYAQHFHLQPAMFPVATLGNDLAVFHSVRNQLVRNFALDLSAGLRQAPRQRNMESICRVAGGTIQAWLVEDGESAIGELQQSRELYIPSVSPCFRAEVRRVSLYLALRSRGCLEYQEPAGAVLIAHPLESVKDHWKPSSLHQHPLILLRQFEGKKQLTA